MFTLHVNHNFVQRRDMVCVTRDPHDSSRDMKMLRDRAEAAFRAGTLDFDLTSGTYYMKEPRS